MLRCVIVSHLPVQFTKMNVFITNSYTGSDLVKRQALMCHRVLRTIEGVAKESAMLTRETWETLLKFLLAANNSLLSPPTEKGMTEHDTLLTIQKLLHNLLAVKPFFGIFYRKKKCVVILNLILLLYSLNIFAVF